MRRGTIAHAIGQVRCALGLHSPYDVRDRTLTVGDADVRVVEICMRCPALRREDAPRRWVNA